MESLRKLDLGKIKKYHSSYYVPHNLCLVVTGRLSTSALLEEVQNTIENRARLHKQDIGPRPEGWKRPFVETESAVAPKLDSDSSIVVEFPAKEEKFGEITMIMIGPSPDDELTLSVRPNRVTTDCSDIYSIGPLDFGRLSYW
jgi:Zn-dependent M16 (insulinase) family peptidase